MIRSLIVLVGLSALSSCSLIISQEDEFLYDVFPDNFKFGFASASYQIEGAWNEDGKGESIWDEFTHRIPSPVVDNTTGDVACDSYHKYAQDVEILKNMGASIYRLSLSWTRILPTGKIDQVNQAGIDYYNKLIDLLLENNIEPLITLYHWDLPLGLMDIGGWANETLVVYFTDYADFAFKTFGDRVKKWITFNEPWVVCMLGYHYGDLAPGIKDPVQAYQCVHTIIKAHAKAFRLYDLTYRPEQKGLIGITLECGWYEPKNASDPSHVEAADRAFQFKHGWFGSPIFFGRYPDIMREYVDRHSEQDGVPSRLPHFTPEEAIEIKGSTDFLGLNHYTSELTEPMVKPGSGWDSDQETESSFDPSWPDSAASWLKVVPWGFRKILQKLKNTYGSPEIYITEQGYADLPETGLQDIDRANYYREYINQLLKAVLIDKVRVTCYTAWTHIDNFEWIQGFSQRFGTHYVNFTDPALTRTPKVSAALLKTIFANNGFPPNSSTV